MRISVKLLIVTALISALIIAATLVNFRQLDRLHHNLVQIRAVIAAQHAAGEMQAALDELDQVAARLGGTTAAAALWPELRQQGTNALQRLQTARSGLARIIEETGVPTDPSDSVIERIWAEENQRDLTRLLQGSNELTAAWARFAALTSGLSAEAAIFRDQQITPLIRAELRPRLQGLRERLEQAAQHEIVETSDGSEQMLRLQIALGAGFLSAILGIAIGVHYIVIQPLREIEASARRVGAGERGFRVKYNRHDELGSVAHALNDMLDSLHASSVTRADLEERVQQRTDQLNDLFDNTTDLIQSVAVDGRLHFVNRAWEETLGYTSDEVASLNLLDVIAAEDRVHLLGVLKRLLAGDDVGMIEVVFQSKDGRRINLEGQLTVRYENGTAVATRGIFRDVTAQHAAARRLAESEARLQRALAGGQQGHWEWNVAAGQDSFTGRWAEILGYQGGVVPPEYQSFLKLIHPADRPPAVAALEEHLKGQTEYYDHELRLRDPAGAWRWILMRGRLAERGPDGRAVRVAGTITDVDARKRAEEALRDRDRRLQIISDNLAECSLYQFTHTPEGKKLFTYFGGGVERLFGEQPAALPVSSSWLRERLVPADIEEMAAVGEQSNRDFTTFSHEARIRAVDGTIKWISFRANPRRLGDGTITWDGIMIDITARRRAEAELLAYRQRLDLALEASRTCTWDNDLVTNVITLDPRWSVMLGHEPVEVRTHVRSLFAVVHPEDRNQALIEAKRAYQGPSDNYRVEYRVRTSQDEWIWIMSNGRVVGRDARGFATRIIGTNTDITERRRTEIAIQQHARFVSTLNATALELLEESDKTRLIKSLALRASQLFDASLAEISLIEGDKLVVLATNEPHGRLIGDRAGREEARISWQAADTCQPVVIDDYSALSTRRTVYDPMRLHAIADFPIVRGGRSIGVISLARTQPGHPFTPDDVQKGVLLAQMTSLALHKAEIYSDAIRLAEARTIELRESEEKFRGVFDKSPMIVGLATVPDGRFVEINETGLAAFGYTREEAIHRDALELKLWADNSDRDRYLKLIRERGGAAGFRARMRRKNGEIFHALHSGSLITIGGASYTLTSVVDISAQVKAEEMQHSMETQLREAQKLESLGTLAGGIAHDFNNILTGLIGFVELARMDLPDDHGAREWVEGIGNSCLRAKDLVRQILTFSRRGETARKPLRLEPIVREALSLLRSTIPAMVEIEQRLSPNCPPISADSSQLHQVLMNLCTNAWHALPENGGRIRVALEPCLVSAELAAAHRGLQPGPHTRLTVNDNGTGMPPDIVERIFEPFFTTKEAGRGTGLGLAVVLGIVQSHDGTIVVSSAPDHGTTIEIYFPAIPGTEVAAGGAKEPAIPRGQGQRIVLVDDDPVVVNVIGRIIRNLGYEVRTFLQSDEALRYFRASADEADLLVTDLAMPVVPGNELAREVLALRPDLPVLMISGYVDPQRLQLIEAAGIRQVIRKPVTAEELARVLAYHLGKRE